jgi:DNA-binding NarL/FixJ family response regulator
MRKNVRLLIANDNPLLLQFLSNVLSDDFCMVGTVSDGKALIAAVMALHPHIIIAGMQTMTSPDAVRQLETLMPDIRVMVLTDHEESECAAAALAADASTFLIKKGLPDLCGKIRAIIRDFSLHIPNYSQNRLVPMGMIVERGVVYTA